MKFKFTRGEFHWFRAAMTMNVGALGRDLVEGQDVEFDGTVLRFEGESHNMPQLRGAIEKDWFALRDSVVNTGHTPQPAGVKARLATAENPREKSARNLSLVVSHDDTHVGTMADFKARRDGSVSPNSTEGISGLEVQTSSSDSGGNVGIDSVPVTASAPVGNVGVDRIATNTSLKRGDLDVVPEPDAVVVSTGFQTSTHTVIDGVKDTINQYENQDPVGSKPAAVASGAPIAWKQGDFHQFIVATRFGSGASDGFFEKGSQLEFDGWMLKYDGFEYTGADVIPIRKAYDADLIVLVSPTVDNVMSESKVETAIKASNNELPLPNGEVWDLSLHWKTRGKLAIERYKDSPEVLATIVAAEKPGVVKMINSNT